LYQVSSITQDQSARLIEMFYLFFDGKSDWSCHVEVFCSCDAALRDVAGKLHMRNSTAHLWSQMLD
jgi:hypothetical protein